MFYSAAWIGARGLRGKTYNTERYAEQVPVVAPSGAAVLSVLCAAETWTDQHPHLQQYQEPGEEIHHE